MSEFEAKITREQLEQRILQMISERSGFPAEEISLDQSLRDLGFDSMDAVDMLFFLEEEYRITVKDEDAQRLTSIGTLVDILERELLNE